MHLSKKYQLKRYLCRKLQNNINRTNNPPARLEQVDFIIKLEGKESGYRWDFPAIPNLFCEFVCVLSDEKLFVGGKNKKLESTVFC